MQISCQWRVTECASLDSKGIPATNTATIKFDASSIWNLLFFQKQVKNSCFYAKKSEKKLWNQQKVWSSCTKKWNYIKINETRDDSFKKNEVRLRNVYIENDFDAINQNFDVGFIFWKSKMQIRCSVGYIEMAVSWKWNHIFRNFARHQIYERKPQFLNYIENT